MDESMGIPDDDPSTMLDVVLAQMRDAVLVVQHGVVLRTSSRATALLGGDVSGRPVSSVVPQLLGGRSESVAARRIDGTDIDVDIDVEAQRVVKTPVAGSHSPQLILMVDSSERREEEAMHAAEELRRRQALEINDTVVQGLAAAVSAMDLGRTTEVRALLERTLTDSRAIMDDLLDPHAGIDLGAGDLTPRVGNPGEGARDDRSGEPAGRTLTDDRGRPPAADRRRRRGPPVADVPPRRTPHVPDCRRRGRRRHRSGGAGTAAAT